MKTYNLRSKLDLQIDSLPNGGELVLSQCNGIVCTVEKSGRGDKLRFVRTSDNGNRIQVFKTVNL